MYDREPTAAQRLLQIPPRRLSAVEYRSGGNQDQQMSELHPQDATYAHGDIDMADAGPSTAPPHATGPTFFHDDD